MPRPGGRESAVGPVGRDRKAWLAAVVWSLIVVGSVIMRGLLGVPPAAAGVLLLSSGADRCPPGL